MTATKIKDKGKGKGKNKAAAADPTPDFGPQLPGQMAITATGEIVEEKGKGKDDDDGKAKTGAETATATATATETDPETDDHAAELAEVSDKIITAMQADKKSWITIYRLIEAVEAGELWRPAYHSLTAWAREVALQGKFQLRELWRYRKAGKFYEEYAARAAIRGRKVPDIETADEKIAGKLSPRNVERIDKIAAGDTATKDRLISGMLSGKLRAPELESMWKAKKAAGGKVRKSRHDDFTDTDADATAEADGKGDRITAQDIVEAISTARGTDEQPPAWLPEAYKANPPWERRKKYRVFTEVPCHTGTTDHAARIDALVAETYGTDQLDEVVLHAIEIKISKSDLLRDTKMQEYADFADYMYLCVPDDPELLAVAAEHVAELQGSDRWGILAVHWQREQEYESTQGQEQEQEQEPEQRSQDTTESSAVSSAEAAAVGIPVLRVVQAPERLPGIMRDKTLAYIVHKLI